jgi:hypothetical protein
MEIALRNVSGVKPGLVTPYGFEDQAWSNLTDARYEPKFGYLSERCVAMGKGGGYQVRNCNGSWQTLAKKEFVVAKLFQEHAGIVTINGVQQNISLDDIRDFLVKGVVTFDGLAYIPLYPRQVWFNGQRLVNTWTEKRVAGRTEDIEALGDFLRMVRMSLCGETDEKTLDEMIREITGSEPTPLRWVMHWLAVPFQRPGMITQTNLWFIGRRGTGKGTLVAVMNRLLGTVGKVSDEEIKRGWTDHLFGFTLAEWDEFEDTWHSFLSRIKKITGNDKVSFTKRNVGTWEHPNVSQHIFSTNQAKPVQVEADDRQNTYLATSPNWEYWQEWVRDTFWDASTNDLRDHRIVTGMGALLGMLEIDWKFIKQPLRTDLRAQYVEAFQDGIEVWYAEDPMVQQYWGEVDINPLAVYGIYREWVKAFDPNKKPEAFRDWRSKMYSTGKMERRQKRVGDGDKRIRETFLVPPEGWTGGSATAFRKVCRGLRLVE